MDTVLEGRTDGSRSDIEFQSNKLDIEVCSAVLVAMG